jgi:hypothetical protein
MYQDQQVESPEDAKLLVRFFWKEQKNNQASLEAGRPIYDETEFVEIRVAGKRDPQAVRPARKADIKRFPRHYQAFKNRTAEPESGTPLREWPIITRSQAEELAYLGVKTVEQLCDVSDTHLGKFMGGHSLKAKAKHWLEKSAVELEAAEKATLMSTIADLQKKVSELMGDPVEAEAPKVEEAEGKPARRKRG